MLTARKVPESYNVDFRTVERKGDWQDRIIGLTPLSIWDAAKLFARKAGRGLHAYDFPSEVDGALPELRSNDDIEGRLEKHPLLKALGCVPRRIMLAASKVDATLPSLREHPDLPSGH